MKIDTIGIRTDFTPFSLDGKYDISDNLFKG